MEAIQPLSPISVLWPPYINLLHARGQIYIGQQYLDPLIKVLTSKFKKIEDKAQFGGQNKSLMLLMSDTSKLACGDLIGSLLICQNSRNQKRHNEGQAHKWSWSRGQEKHNGLWSQHANLEVSGINNIKDLFWPPNWALSSVYSSFEVKTSISGPRCSCPIYIWPLECSKLIKGGQRTEIGG